jgi:hypothetical protein
MLEKAERFAPGAGKKHRAQADDDYATAVEAGNSERDEPGTAAPRPDRSEPTAPGQTAESSGP